MRIGITGTREGVGEGQLAELRRILLQADATELHHGDCVGADAQAHAVARELGLRIVLHPPNNAVLRAFCEGADVEHRPRPYLMRNRDIVDAVDLLVALPKDMDERPQSGTWSTVRYARANGRPARVIEPPPRRDAGP